MGRAHEWDDRDTHPIEEWRCAPDRVAVIPAENPGGREMMGDGTLRTHAQIHIYWPRSATLIRQEGRSLAARAGWKERSKH